MGSQKSSESTSYSGSAQKWALPYAKQGVGAVFNAYNAAQPTLDRAVAGTSGLAHDLNNQFSSGQEQAGQAQHYYGDELSGKYLNNNPYLQQNIDAAKRGVYDTTASNFNLAGRYGSGAMGKGLAQGLGDVEAQMRMGDYNAERERMGQAAAGALGSNSASASQALGAYGQQGQLPYAGMSNLSQSLAALFNGGNSKSVQYAPNPLWGAAGAALGAAGSYFAGPAGSDRRLKKNITFLSTRPDNLNVYSWVYKNDPSQTVCTGYMADEVKDIYPDAFIPDFNGTGYSGVDYGKIPHEHKLAA